MIIEWGHLFLWMAAGLSAIQAALVFIPTAVLEKGRVRSTTMRLVAVQSCLVLLSVLALWYAFITSDFTVLYVADNSNTMLPLIYRISALWGAHEGSLLLWALILSLWSVLFSFGLRGRFPRVLLNRCLAILGWVSLAFLLFMLFTSNPFARQFPPPLQGRDLNPLLQDPGLAIHPPLLYMGYVGFALPFAFAVAVLWQGEIKPAWVRSMRPWVLFPWMSLTLGIALGSWWAYHELGWGGWWFWDPVENASLMPWLVGTGLIHAMAVSEKRNMGHGWVVLLAIAAFALSLLGTFLVRSGIIISVHAFANDPDRGIFILAFFFVLIGGSLGLFAWRGSRLMTGFTMSWFSREGLLLVNNLLLVVMAMTILWGTLYPLSLELLGLGQVSVGGPYFEKVTAPWALALLLMLMIIPFVSWKRQSWRSLMTRHMALLGAIGFIVAGGLIWLWNWKMWLAGIAIVLAVPVLASALYDLWRHRKAPSRAIIGMTMAHIGFSVLIIGAVIASGFKVEREVSFSVGDSQTLGGHEFTLVDLESIKGQNYDGVRAWFSMQDEHGERMFSTEKRFYQARSMGMTEAGIMMGWWRDFYVALGEPIDGGQRWTVRLYSEPLVRWIWGGAVIMFLGGGMAASDRRYWRSKQLEHESFSNEEASVTLAVTNVHGAALAESGETRG